MQTYFILPNNIKYYLFLLFSMIFFVIGNNLFEIQVTDPVRANDMFKLYTFSCIIGQLAIAAIPLLIVYSVRFRITACDVCVVLFGGWILYNSGIGPRESLLILLIAYYFFIRIIAGTAKEPYFMAVFVLLLSGLIQVTAGFRQLYDFAESNHSLYKMTGTFLNPGPYSGFLATILPLALYWMLKIYPGIEKSSLSQMKSIIRSPQQTGKYLLFGLATLFCFGTVCILPAGMSRSAWIAASCGCAVVLAKHYRLKELVGQYYRDHRRTVCLCFFVALIVISGAGAGMYLMKKSSADGRMMLWKTSAQTIARHPWTGVGYGYFPGAFGQTQAEYFASGKGTQQEEMVAGSPEYGFNEYLQIGVEQGVIGLLLFLGIAAGSIWQAAKSKTEGSNGMIGSLTAILVFASFSYPLRVLPLCLVFIQLLAIAQGYPPPDKQKKHSGRSLNVWATRAFAVCLIVMVFLLTRNKENMQDAYIRWSEEKTYFNMNIFEGTVDHYRQLYPRLKHEGSFLFEYGQCLSKTGQYEESNRILTEGTQFSSDPMFYNIMGKNYQALKQYDKAEEAFRRACLVIPHRLYPLYLLAKMYFESGQTEKGVEAARQLIAKEPKVSSSATEDMKKEMEQAVAENEKQITETITE